MPTHPVQPRTAQLALPQQRHRGAGTARANLAAHGLCRASRVLGCSQGRAIGHRPARMNVLLDFEILGAALLPEGSRVPVHSGGVGVWRTGHALPRERGASPRVRAAARHLAANGEAAHVHPRRSLRRSSRCFLAGSRGQGGRSSAACSSSSSRSSRSRRARHWSWHPAATTSTRRSQRP